MTEKQVCRYLELVDRRLFILLHSGIDWQPEYAQELEYITQELVMLRGVIDEAHYRREAKTA